MKTVQLRVVTAQLMATVLGLTCATAPIVQAAEPPTAQSPARGPRLTITDASHDFGTVTQGKILSHTFRISNGGDALLAINEITPSCGCTTTGDWPHTLKPGESGAIPVNVDTERFTGPISKTISIASNDPTRPTTILVLKATIWTPVSIENPVLVFQAATNPNQSSTRATTLRNETANPMTLGEPQSTSAAFKPVLKPVIAGKEYELTVTTVPPLPEGSQVARITMKTSLPEAPEITVQAVVTVLPAVQVAPSQILLSVPRLAAPEKRFAVILNHRDYDLAVTDVTTNAAGVEVATTKSDDGKQFTIALTFPAGFAVKSGEKLFLRGRTNHPSVPEFEIPIVSTTAN